MVSERCDLLCLDLPRAEELRKARLAADEATRMAAVVAALGDPTRLVIAMALRDGGELCVCDLAWIVERSQNLVSHHVRLLRNQALVRSRRGTDSRAVRTTPSRLASAMRFATTWARSASCR